jgi:hypothetical protein
MAPAHQMRPPGTLLRVCALSNRFLPWSRRFPLLLKTTMNTKWLMVVTSIVLGTTGILLLFAPELLLEALGTEMVEPLPVVVQVLAGVYLSFALMNWTIRASVIGGIYNRPLALGNFTHFFIGMLVLLKYLFTGSMPMVLVIATCGYTLFVALFAWLVFKHRGISAPP